MHGHTNLAGRLEVLRQWIFCKDDYRLPQIRCEVWAGWIMQALTRMRGR